MPHLRRRLGFVLFAALVAIGCDTDASDGARSTLLDDEDGDGIVVAGTRIQVDLESERAAALSSFGGYLHLPEGGAIVINHEGSILAFADRCPTDDCPVDRFADGLLRCSCDDSRFATDGTPVSNSATTPLQRYTVTRSGDIITILRTEPGAPPTPSEPDPYTPPYGY